MSDPIPGGNPNDVPDRYDPDVEDDADVEPENDDSSDSPQQV